MEGPARGVLVQRAMQGDHDAFARLAADSIAHLYAIARLILGDADDAEDAVQEALVHAWRELPRLRDCDRFDAWVRRLLVNACHDVGRRRQRHVLVGWIEPAGERPALDEWGTVEERERLERAFKRLPVEQRAVLVLEHYVGLTGPEIAAAADIPLGTVKSRTRYAIGAMRAALEADDRIPVPAKGHVA